MAEAAAPLSSGSTLTVEHLAASFLCPSFTQKRTELEGFLLHTSSFIYKEEKEACVCPLCVCPGSPSTLRHQNASVRIMGHGRC